MKKSIKSLVQKLTIEGDNRVAGGFGSIKGGFGLAIVPDPNGDCSNTGTCTGTNDGNCDNTKTCTGTNNGGSGKGCFNHLYCGGGA